MAPQRKIQKSRKKTEKLGETKPKIEAYYIDGNAWKIEESNTINMDENADGTSTPRTMTITIFSDLAPERKKIVLLHETSHELFYKMQYIMKDTSFETMEFFCDTVGNFIFSLLRDNDMYKILEDVSK